MPRAPIRKRGCHDKATAASAWKSLRRENPLDLPQVMVAVRLDDPEPAHGGDPSGARMPECRSGPERRTELRQVSPEAGAGGGPPGSQRVERKVRLRQDGGRGRLDAEIAPQRGHDDALPQASAEPHPRRPGGGLRPAIMDQGLLDQDQVQYHVGE